MSPYRTATLAPLVAPAVPRMRRFVRRIRPDSILYSILSESQWFRRAYGGRWSRVSGCGGAQSWLRFEECPAKTRWCGGCSDVMCGVRLPRYDECGMGRRCACEVYE